MNHAHMRWLSSSFRSKTLCRDATATTTGLPVMSQNRCV